MAAAQMNEKSPQDNHSPSVDPTNQQTRINNYRGGIQLKQRDNTNLDESSIELGADLSI